MFVWLFCSYMWYIVFITEMWVETIESISLIKIYLFDHFSKNMRCRCFGVHPLPIYRTSGGKGVRTIVLYSIPLSFDFHSIIKSRDNLRISSLNSMTSILLVFCRYSCSLCSKNAKEKVLPNKKWHYSTFVSVTFKLYPFGYI